MPDGKVTYEYVGDTSGIDKANQEAEEKVKSSGSEVESTAKKTAANAGDAYKAISNGIKNTSSVSKTLSGELSDVNRLLKLDPKNADLVRQKFDILKESISGAKDKLVDLKSKQDQMASDLASGKIDGKAYREYQRKVADAEQEVKNLSKQQDDFAKSSGTFGQKIKASMSDIGSAIKDNLGKAAGIALGAASAALTGFTKNGLELAKNLTEVQNVVDTTFGNNSATINKWSENAGKQFGIGELDAKRYSSTIGAMFKSMGLGQKDVLNMSEGITGLAGDMASFYNLDPAEAFEKLRSGISGETEPLKQLGINMDETNLSAFALKEGISKPYKEMSQSEQTMLRYQYLLSVTKDAQGDYSKTANSAANQQRTLKMEYDEVSAKVGSALLPLLTKALGLAQKIIVPISNFVSAHPKLSAAIVGITIVLGGLIGGMTILSGIMPFLTALFPALGTSAAVAGVGINFAFLPLLLIAAAIAGVIAVGVLLATHWKQISAIAQTVGNAIKGAFLAAVDAVKAAWNGIIGFFGNIWNAIKTGFVAAGNGIKVVATVVWNAIRTAIMAIVLPLVTGVMNLWNSMKTGIQTVMNGLKNILSGIWTVIKNIFVGALLLILDLVTGNFTKLHDDALKIFSNIQQGIAQIWEGIKQVFIGALEAIAGFWSVTWNGISSIAVTIWNGLIAFFTSLPGTIGGIMDAVGSWIRGVWDGLIGFFASIPGRAWSALSGIGGAIRGAFSDAIGFITSLPSQALQWGRDIIDGIVNGIRQAAHHVQEAVSGVAENIRSFLHFSQPDEGPLREFPEWPRDMMKTWGDELSGNDDYVMNAVQKVTRRVSSSFDISSKLQGNVVQNIAPAAATGINNIAVSSAPINLTVSADAKKMGIVVTREQWKNNVTRRYK